MAPHLLIADDVARLLSAAQLAHCDANIDDPDLLCWTCTQTIASSEQAALTLLTDQTFALITYTQPACRRSGVYPTPSLRGVAREHYARKVVAGIDIATLLALRSTAPRALLFLELPILVPLPCICRLGIHRRRLSPVKPDHLRQSYRSGATMQRFLHWSRLVSLRPRGWGEIALSNQRNACIRQRATTTRSPHQEGEQARHTPVPPASRSSAVTRKP